MSIAPNATSIREADALLIATLHEALEKIGSQAICYGMSADESELRDWLRFISETAEDALNQVRAIL